MSWHDLGLIFKVNNLAPWAQSHAYVPTAIELKDCIRIFVAFWDSHTCGRLGFIDVCEKDPTKVLNYSNKPIIEDSSQGCFDCDGITPLSILKDHESTRLYYAGWQKTNDLENRYTLFIGLLIGDINTNNFKRYSELPVIGPRDAKEYVRTGGQVLKTPKGYYCWLATQKGTHSDFGKSLPIYDLECVTSKNGLDWPNRQDTVFKHTPGNTLGFGRSAIWINNNKEFEGLFSVRKWDGSYSDILYSHSKDGFRWADLKPSGKAFLTLMTCDYQESVCFPSIIHQKDKMLMFYSGDNFGKAGLRLAIWMKEI